VHKAKCRVLHMGQGNPRYQCRLGDEGMESRPAEKDLVVLGDEKLDHQCALAAQKANHALGCISSSVGSRASAVTLPLCSALTPPGVLHPALEPSAQDRPGPVGSRTRGGHSNDPRVGTPLL